MSLAALLCAFYAEIAAADDGIPPSSPGMEIYRNAYRGRLLAALETSFERTRAWVGTEAFTAAACHYIIAFPPRGWTLDDYGADFPSILHELFAQDPEVAELAWLEWHMQRAFAAPDGPVLDAAALTCAGYADADWERIRFTMNSGFAGRWIATNCADIWHCHGQDPRGEVPVRTEQRRFLLVWRAGLSPVFRITDATEGMLLEKLAGGAAFGEVATMTDPGTLGPLLRRWLSDGLLAGSHLPN